MLLALDGSAADCVARTWLASRSKRCQRLHALQVRAMVHAHWSTAVESDAHTPARACVLTKTWFAVENCTAAPATALAVTDAADGQGVARQPDQTLATNAQRTHCCARAPASAVHCGAAAMRTAAKERRQAPHATAGERNERRRSAPPRRLLLHRHPPGPPRPRCAARSAATGRPAHCEALPAAFTALSAHPAAAGGAVRRHCSPRKRLGPAIQAMQLRQLSHNHTTFIHAPAHASTKAAWPR